MNNLFKLLIIASLSWACLAADGDPNAPAPALFYNMEIIDADGFFVDSVNARNAKVQGSVQILTGYIGNGALFNENTQDGVANAGVGDFGQAFTVVAWVKILDLELDSPMKIASKKEAWDAPQGWEIEYNAAPKQFVIAGSGAKNLVVPYTFDDQFHLVVVAYNIDTVTIWVDGDNITPEDDQKVTPLVDAPEQELLIGSSSLVAPAGGYFRGYIDEFRIFDGALTADQVTVILTTDRATAEGNVNPGTTTGTTNNNGTNTNSTGSTNPNPKPTSTTGATVVVVTSDASGYLPEMKIVAITFIGMFIVKLLRKFF